MHRRKIQNLFRASVFLISLGLTMGCGEQHNAPQAKDQRGQAGKVDEDSVKPVITSDYKDNVDPRIFEAAFLEGSTVKMYDDLTYSFEVLEAGKLKCESGKIIACDPIQMQGAIPFTQEFPKGEFPVQIAIANEMGHKDGDEAFCRVVFSKEPVAVWKVALQPGEEPVSLDSAYCFGNDAARGIFIDSAANRAFTENSEADWNRIFMDGMDKHGRHGYVYSFSGHTMAIYHTGAGDGCYPCYIGFDKNGKPCRLLCDFGIIDW